MIPKLFIGRGSQIKSRDGLRFQLTNGYIINKQTANTTKKEDEENFMKAATAYFTSFGTDNKLAMLGGNLTKIV